MFVVLVRLISRFSWPRSGPIEVEKLNVCDNAPAMPSVLLSLSLSLSFSFPSSSTPFSLFLAPVLPFPTRSLSDRYARFVASWNALNIYLRRAKRPRPGSLTGRTLSLARGSNFFHVATATRRWTRNRERPALKYNPNRGDAIFQLWCLTSERETDQREKKRDRLLRDHFPIG